MYRCTGRPAFQPYVEGRNAAHANTKYLNLDLGAGANFKASGAAVLGHGEYGYAGDYHVELYFCEPIVPRIASRTQAVDHVRHDKKCLAADILLIPFASGLA